MESETLVSDEIKKRDYARRTALFLEKRKAKSEQLASYHKLPNEFRPMLKDHYDDFYLGD